MQIRGRCGKRLRRRGAGAEGKEGDRDRRQGVRQRRDGGEREDPRRGRSARGRGRTLTRNPGLAGRGGLFDATPTGCPASGAGSRRWQTTDVGGRAAGWGSRRCPPRPRGPDPRSTRGPSHYFVHPGAPTTPTSAPPCSPRTPSRPLRPSSSSLRGPGPRPDVGHQPSHLSRNVTSASPPRGGRASQVNPWATPRSPQVRVLLSRPPQPHTRHEPGRWTGTRGGSGTTCYGSYTGT